MPEESTENDSSKMTTPRFRDAYAQREEEMNAIPEDEVVVPNVEIPVAVTTVIGAAPKIRATRPHFTKHLTTFPMNRFDNLESYALALGHAHILHLAASAPAEAMPELVSECQAVRETLLINAQVAAHHGLIDGLRLRELRGTNGHRHTAFDLFLLSQLLRENWPKLEGKTLLKADDLNTAESLADRLATAVGTREQTSVAASATAATRDRAFTLFIKAYTEVRRAVLYLYPNDGEEIAPTLYTGRGPTKKRPEQDAKASTETQAAPAQAEAKPAATPAPTSVEHDSPYAP
jgi:hypothetical protein